MTTNVSTALLRRQLKELREAHAFWCSQPGQVRYTLASLQQQIDELKAQLKALDAAQ